MGRVEGIYLRASSDAEASLVERVEVRAGRGLVGDRYFDGGGTFSEEGRTGQDLTLIDPAETRRNVVTRGIALNDLVGKRFLVGSVECYGQRLCEPCAHLERLTHEGVLRGLVHRGGLRADVLTDGEIAGGAAVVPL